MARYDMTGIGINLREVTDENGDSRLKVWGTILDGPAHSAGVRQVDKYDSANLLCPHLLKITLCHNIFFFCFELVIDININIIVYKSMCFLLILKNLHIHLSCFYFHFLVYEINMWNESCYALSIVIATQSISHMLILGTKYNALLFVCKSIRSQYTTLQKLVNNLCGPSETIQNNLPSPSLPFISINSFLLFVSPGIINMGVYKELFLYNIIVFLYFFCFSLGGWIIGSQ